MPFFSPDGQWLGFRVGQKLMKVSVSGDTPGPPVTIADPVSIDRGASWGPDGWIVYNRAWNVGLSRISADGGEPEILTTPSRERNEKNHRLPQVLLGGKAVIFTLGTGDILSYEAASIAVLDLESSSAAFPNSEGNLGLTRTNAPISENLAPLIAYR
ncbi:MAG: hypothetical protein BMS9Abin37_3217 [Acidobacteriota bacterium]|nr:MAG: hypothetical protein BMS9Abin37_3217 [Acidobacteriota bacterium]